MRSVPLQALLFLICAGSIAAQPQPSVRMILPMLIDALEARSAEDLRRLSRSEAHIPKDFFDDLTEIRFDEAKVYGVQAFMATEAPDRPVFELVVVFERSSAREDTWSTFKMNEPWRVASVHKRRKPGPLSFAEMQSYFTQEAMGDAERMPADDHEFQFEDFIRRVARGEERMLRFLRENDLADLRKYRLIPADETYYFLTGLSARQAGDPLSLDLMLTFLAAPAPGWYLSEINRSGGPSSAGVFTPISTPISPPPSANPAPEEEAVDLDALPEALRSLVGKMVERTGMAEAAAFDLLVNMLDLVEELEADLNRIADPDEPHAERLALVDRVVETYFASPTVPVEISNTANSPIVTRPVDRYLRSLSRISERYGYISVDVRFDLGFEFYDIERVRSEKEQYEAAIVVYQVFEAKTPEGTGYQDVTKKRLYAFIERTDAGAWGIKFTRIGVDDTYTLEHYLGRIRPRLSN